MKITDVSVRRRRKAFEVTAEDGRRFDFPFGRAEPPPTDSDPVVELFVDPEVANEGFVYRLASGANGTILLDWVLWVNRDPAYLAELELYRLTCEAQDRFARSGMSAREVGRRVGTSAAQVRRLLDQTNYSKSMLQLIAVLHALGCQVDITVTDPERAAS